MSSADFYDDFITYQIDSGINDRIYSLYKRLCKIGISTDDSILEIGCGIGCLTYLLSRKIKKGKIEAVDISRKSVEYAKSNIKNPNLYFSAADILTFEPRYSEFNKVLLFDVLEHINEEDHISLFIKIARWMSKDALLLINLPNAYYILYDQKNKPQKLQETDQPIFLNKLAGSLSKASLEIEYLETYSIWVKNDYHFLIVKKKAEFEERFISAERNLIEKIVIRSKRVLRKLYYPYPI